MVDVNELRKGATFEFNSDIFKVVDYRHSKPGRGKATIRLKSRNLRTGALIDMTFTSGERIQDIRLDHHNVQYLYNDGSFYYFMDLDNYEQTALRAEIIEEAIPYLKEELEVKLTFFEREALDIDLPTTVDLEVVEAEAAVRGDTATGLQIKVKLETGLEVQVPSFISAGDTIRVDTRTGAYVTRV